MCPLLLSRGKERGKKRNEERGRGKKSAPDLSGLNTLLCYKAAADPTPGWVRPCQFWERLILLGTWSNQQLQLYNIVNPFQFAQQNG